MNAVELLLVGGLFGSQITLSVWLYVTLQMDQGGQR